MSEEKGNLKGLAISFIVILLIMGAGVGIVYFCRSKYLLNLQTIKLALNWKNLKINISR